MPKRILTGTVTSDANAQTVTVSVERRFTHPVLKKPSVSPRSTGLTMNRMPSKLVIKFVLSNAHRSRRQNAGKCSQHKLRLLTV